MATVRHRADDHYIWLYRSKDGRRNLATVRKLGASNANMMNRDPNYNPWKWSARGIGTKKVLVLKVDEVVDILRKEGYSI